MASLTPSEEEISRVVDFANLDPKRDRDVIIQALKDNNRSVETVLEKYFTDAAHFREKYSRGWVDSMFSADRDGSTATQAGISFHIESSTDNSMRCGTPPSHGDNFNPVAPSRPPSRSEARSPLGNNWAAVHTGADYTPRSQEDEDMERALRASALEAGFLLETQPADIAQARTGLNGQGRWDRASQKDKETSRALHGATVPASGSALDQERSVTRSQKDEEQQALSGQRSGVLAPSTLPEPTFGPANRNDYDQENWAMIPSDPSKIVSDDKPPTKTPALVAQRRSPGSPAFLIGGRSAADSSVLGGMLTVLHAIPLARNTLLQLGASAKSYGFHSRWWRGQAILPQKMLDEVRNGRTPQEGLTPSPDLEIHRLMAFLDTTDRSFGTVGVLAGSLPDFPLPPEIRFFHLLGTKDMDRENCLLHSLAYTSALDDDAKVDLIRLGLLNTGSQPSDYGCIKTLYECLDQTLWDEALDKAKTANRSSRMYMFKETGEVLVIRLNGEGPPTSVEIPEKLYLERYNTSRKGEARQVHSALRQIKDAIARISAEEDVAMGWQVDDSNTRYSRKEVIVAIRERYQAYNNYFDTLNQFRRMERQGFEWGATADGEVPTNSLAEDEVVMHRKVADVLKLTNDMLHDLDTRISELRVRMDRIAAQQRFIGRLLTQPDKPGRARPMTCKELLLRGLVTPSNVIYLCQRVEVDSTEMGDEPLQLDQWWKLAYKETEKEPIITEKMDLEQVLQDVWKETKTPMMVYATNTALSTPRASLSEPLQRFARAQNMALSQELRQEEAEAGNGAAWPEPISPVKRKHRADSMDSTRASVGSDGVREMLVDADSRQPSPKDVASTLM